MFLFSLYLIFILQCSLIYINILQSLFVYVTTYVYQLQLEQFFSPNSVLNFFRTGNHQLILSDLEFLPCLFNIYSCMWSIAYLLKCNKYRFISFLYCICDFISILFKPCYSIVSDFTYFLLIIWHNLYLLIYVRYIL